LVPPAFAGVALAVADFVPVALVAAVVALVAGALAAFVVLGAAFFAVGFAAAASVVALAGARLAAAVTAAFFAGADLAGTALATVGVSASGSPRGPPGFSAFVATCAGIVLFAAFRTASVRSAMAFPHMQNGRTAGRRALQGWQEYGT
jgi:hypothetical protein